MSVPVLLSLSIIFLVLVARDPAAMGLPMRRSRRQPLRLQNATSVLPDLPHSLDYYPRDPRDIYHVTFLLRQKLLPELLPQVLDDAEYWLKSTTERSGKVSVSDRNHRMPMVEQAGLHYLSSEPIGDGRLRILQPIRKVVFTISSMDQGRSDYPQNHGTYNNSWTWFEAVTRGRDVIEAIPAQSRKIVTNVHAGKEYKTHVIAWTFDSNSEEERNWVNHNLKRGRQVDITMWAQYPGWRNNVAAARIDIYTAAVR